MEVDGVVEGDHHADGVLVVLSAAGGGTKGFVLGLFVARHALQVPHHLGALLGVAVKVVQRRLDVLGAREPDQVVHPRHRPDEVAVRHVRQRRQVCLVVVPRLVRPLPLADLHLAYLRRTVADAPARPQPLVQFALCGLRVQRRREADALKGPVVDVLGGAVGLVLVEGEVLVGVERRRGRHPRRHLGRVLDRQLAAGAFLHERQRRREDALPPLARLHRPCDEALAVPHPLHVVQDRYLRVARQHEVAVHAVHREVLGDRRLRGGQTLRDRRPAVDASCARWVPEWSGVGVDVRSDVDEGEEREDILNGRVVRE